MANYSVGNIEIGTVVNDKATDTLDNIINKINKINQMNVKLKKGTQSVNSGLNDTNEKLKKGTQSVNSGLNDTNKKLDKISKSIDIGKIYLIFNYAKQIFGQITKLIKYSSDYVETLNKFQVSFGSLYEENLQWVNSLSKAYGFSRRTLMEYSATFNNMLSSLKGLNNEMSATISRTLTQMAIDYSSLFNRSIESTMLAFQSMLSGSIRPIRSSSGFDVSETSIFQVYKELGGTKTMRQLTQLEKRLLRIIAVQQQMQATGTVGDYAKTIESFSNQLRIFKEQVIELGSTWGKIFLVKLKPVLVYLNAIILSINAIGDEISKTIDLTGDFKLDEEFASMSTSVDSVSDSVDELENKLTQLSLDQLNVLGSSTTSNNLGIDEKILNAVQTYKSNLDKISFKAQEISRKILQWLGYTYNENGELQKTDDRLSNIFTGVKVLIVSILGFKLSKRIMTIFNTIKNIKASGKPIISKLSIISAIVATIVGGFIDLYNTNEEFKNKVDQTIASIGEGLSTIFDNIKPFFDYVTEALSYISGNLVYGLLNVIESIVKLLTGDFSGAIDALKKNFISLGDTIAKVFGADNWATMMANIRVELISFKNFVYNQIIRPIGNSYITSINSFLTSVEFEINELIKFINNFTKAVSQVWTWAGIPGISPIGTVHFNKIPYFAKGNVATEPTVGMFGEYANAKNNPEITTPQNIMRETFTETLVPLVNAILKGDNEVVKAIKNQNLTLNVNGRQLAESTINDFNDVAIRKGKILFNK